MPYLFNRRLRRLSPNLFRVTGLTTEVEVARVTAHVDTSVATLSCFVKCNNSSTSKLIKLHVGDDYIDLDFSNSGDGVRGSRVEFSLTQMNSKIDLCVSVDGYLVKHRLSATPSGSTQLVLTVQLADTGYTDWLEVQSMEVV